MRWGLTGGEEPELKPLGGGVSCHVVLVTSSKGKWVVKKALPRLMVKDEWLADRWRIFRETGCLKVIRELVDKNAAPRVLLEDRESYSCVLEYGEGGVTWKKLLMDGVVDNEVTIRVASILAKIHTKTSNRSEIVSDFWDDTNFIQLRIDPYINHLAKKHLDIAPHLYKISQILTSRKLSLVHGDYSPKNILILPDSRIWVLDCEPAHYGNPVFDIAFCTNHLVLKAIHLNSEAHLNAAKLLWKVYWSTARWENFHTLEEEATLTLTAHMLARIDGKSPVEYLNEEKRAKVRILSKNMIIKAVNEFEKLCEEVRGSL